MIVGVVYKNVYSENKKNWWNTSFIVIESKYTTFWFRTLNLLKLDVYLLDI